MGMFRTILPRSIQARCKRWMPSPVTINGSNAWDPKVRDDRVYEAVFYRGTLGLGEAYMDGWWDCQALDVFFEHVFRAGLLEKFRHHPTMFRARAREMLFNEQKRSRATRIAEHHYNPESNIILSFLDPYNQYTCGYWKDADDLKVAQERKLDLISRKLELKSGDKVLDIGCGWGGFAKYAAEHFGCRVIGITNSPEQIEYAEKYCRGLPVTIQNCDYRDLTGTFDKILICGMGEHVGHKNYRTLMKSVHRCLAPHGLFLWHTIGKGSDGIPLGEPWILKYIFPAGMLPTPQRIARATEGLFDQVDLHEFGAYYDPTLMAWRENFVKNWPAAGAGRTLREFRMWYYYLSSCAALFRVRKINLWQFVFRKAGAGKYISVR